MVIGVILIAAGLLAYFVGRTDPLVKRLQESPTADRHGFRNEATGRDLYRLRYLATHVGPILDLVSQHTPGVYVSSGYRGERLNNFVGGSPNSRHRLGLAFDIGGFGGSANRARIRSATRFLRRNLSSIRDQLQDPPLTVIAEHDHIHLSWSDPLGVVPDPHRPTAWLQETDDPSDRFKALA